MAMDPAAVLLENKKVHNLASIAEFLRKIEGHLASLRASAEKAAARYA